MMEVGKEKVKATMTVTVMTTVAEASCWLLMHCKVKMIPNPLINPLHLHLPLCFL